jgi:hypothetical protein
MSCRDLWHQVETETPKPEERWSSLTLKQRNLEVRMVLAQSECSDYLEVDSCTVDGEVYFTQIKPIETALRAALLLDLEELLQDNIDRALTLWIKPQNDKNSLRRLRGVELKLL